MDAFWWLVVFVMLPATGLILMKALKSLSVVRLRKQKRVPVVAIDLNELETQVAFEGYVAKVDRDGLATFLAGQPDLSGDEPYGLLRRNSDGGYEWTPDASMHAFGLEPLCLEVQNVAEVATISGNVVDDCHWTRVLLTDGSQVSFKTSIFVIFSEPEVVL